MDGAVNPGRLAPAAGLLGSALIGTLSLIAALAYQGVVGEPYSPLNHFVSELGELGVSSLAAVFNLGLIAGGVCFAIFMIGLGRTRGGAWGAVYGALGAITGAAGALVGVFPANSGGPHLLAAATFFNLAWISIALVSTDILLRPDHRFPAGLAVIGFVAVVPFVSFLGAWLLSGTATSRGLQPAAARSAVDPVTALEWASIVAVLTWTTSVAVSWGRVPHRGVA